jgi:3-methyl-2-oxobutanoate hydroxymethyltransferase
MDKKVTYSDILEEKRRNHKVIAISCYDYTTAKLVSQTDVHMILVGDSAAQAALGFD